MRARSSRSCWTPAFCLAEEAIKAMFGQEMKDTRVAGLADGELSAEQAQALAGQLKLDSLMQTELQEQREVKELLADLPQYSAPDFMSTRIMGEIAARRTVP